MSSKGQFYWCVKVVKDLSAKGEILLFADNATVSERGCLVFKSQHNSAKIVLVIAPGKWTAYYAASTLDGAPVGVEHWDSELIEYPE